MCVTQAEVLSETVSLLPQGSDKSVYALPFPDPTYGTTLGYCLFILLNTNSLVLKAVVTIKNSFGRVNFCKITNMNENVDILKDKLKFPFSLEKKAAKLSLHLYCSPK